MKKHTITVALIFGVYLLFPGTAFSESTVKSVYLTLEDDDSGAAVLNCNESKSLKNCSEKIATINRSASIQITGAEFKAKTIDPFDDSLTEEIFVPVQYSFIENSNGAVKFKEGKGYLPKYLLSEKKLTAFYSAEEKDNSRMPAAALTAGPKTSSKVVKAANEIYEIVGECAVSPATQLPKKLPKKNIYDSLAYPRLVKHKVPALLNEKIEPMTMQDLVNIDALARTIYGEMGICFKKGLQYPIAAALVAVNRHDNKSRFKEWTSTQTKRGLATVPDLTRILTTPEKFNNWMAKNGQKPNGPLHHSLCPPRFVNMPFWKSERASQDQVDIWKNAVRIATEAVLFPKKFKSRSPATRNINFYTSGMGQYYNFLQVFPFINDHPLEHFDCIEMWKEPNK